MQTATTLGTLADQYELLEKIGEGAAGAVYLARDLRLNRKVALKFLTKGNDPENYQRFEREARAAAQIDHPNVCTIFDFGESEDTHYYVMAYVDGGTLADRLADGPLDLETVHEMAIQIALGIEAAHSFGLIHRDIKPNNIMLTSGGVPKIADFGLAVVSGDETLTLDDSTLGTPAYMSPEQAKGQVIDHRTDIWSVGVTIYEMLAGERPFRGPNLPAILHSIAYDELDLAQFVKPEHKLFLPILSRSLAKNPEDRYQTISELLADLKNIEAAGLDSTRVAPEQQARMPCVAVFPFANLNNEELEYFSDGLTDDIIYALARVDGLRVVSRTSVFQFKNQQVDTRTFAENLNATAVIEGNVRSAGDRVRVTVQLVNSVDGVTLWSERFDRKLEDIFDIQDEITNAVVEALKGKLRSQSKPAPQTSSENSFRAYDLYLKGRYQWNRQTEEGMMNALQFFNQAIESDPALGVAYAGLADAYFLTGSRGIVPSQQALQESRKFAQKALTLDASLSDANLSMAYVNQFLEWDWQGAEGYLRRAIQLNPSDARAYFTLSALLSQKGMFRQARSAMQKAIELDPLNPMYQCGAGWTEYYAQRPRVAVELLEQTIELIPDYPETYIALGAANEQLGMYEAAVSTVESAIDKFGADPLAIGFLGAIYGGSGEIEKARETISTVEQLAKERYVPAICKAVVYLGMREKELALTHLEEAVKARDSFCGWLKVLPLAQWVSDEPRFQSMLAEIGVNR